MVINAENARMAELQAQIQADSERLRMKAWRLGLRQSASDAVHQRRHMSHLPPNYEPRQLFTTPLLTSVQGTGVGGSGTPVMPVREGGAPTAAHVGQSVQQQQQQPPQQQQQ